MRLIQSKRGSWNLLIFTTGTAPILKTPHFSVFRWSWLLRVIYLSAPQAFLLEGSSPLSDYTPASIGPKSLIHVGLSPVENLQVTGWGFFQSELATTTWQCDLATMLLWLAEASVWQTNSLFSLINAILWLRKTTTFAAEVFFSQVSMLGVNGIASLPLIPESL